MKKGWEEKKLGEVIKLEYGKPLPDDKRISNGKYPVYGANGEKDRTDEYYHNKQSIVVGRKGSAGEINLTEKRFWPLDVAYFVTFDHAKYDLNFIYHLLSNLELPKLAKGVKPGINRNEVYSINVQIPPLPEQKRIVGILDRTFAAISTVKENTEKNLQNARELFESYLQSVFANPGDGWEEKKLKTITTKIGSGATPLGGEKAYHAKGISLIRSLNVHDMGFRVKDLAFLDRNQADKLSNVVVECGDVLLNITGASVARCCIVPQDVLPARVNQHVSIIRLIKDVMIPKFLYYTLISRVYKEKLLNTGEKGGSTRQAITKAQIENFSIKYPKSLSEQQRIVAKLDALSAETKKIETIYQQKLADLDELKKSLLHQAFTGQLTAGASIQSVSAAIPFPKTLSNISTTDLHAGVLAMAFQLHEKNNKMEYFTHVKAEKIAHMVEARLGIDLGRKPVKDAAGPNDFPHLHKVEHRARKANFFDFKQVQGGPYQVQKLRGFERLIDKTRTVLGQRLADVEGLLQWMLPMTVQQAEIVATVYAAWNNLLLYGRQPTDEEIVREAREDWHPHKLKIEREKFFKAIGWMREQNVVPEGKGKRVVKKVA